MDDKKIIDLFFARDEDAIRETGNKYGAKLNALAKNILESAEDGQECVNDAYMKAWDAIPPAKPEYLFAFLATITRRLAIDRIRCNNAKKRQAVIVELTNELSECIADESATWSEDYESRDASGIISDYLKSIEPRKRIIFLRRYWYSDSVKEISSRMGMSESAVKTSLHRTRNELRDYLIKEGYLR